MKSPVSETAEKTDLVNCHRFRGIKFQSDYLRCLIPLLDSLDWKGHDRDLVEALPVELDSMDQDAFLTTMSNLNYESRILESRLNRFDIRLLPCLFIRPNKSPKVIIRELDDAYLIYDAATGQFGRLPISRKHGNFIYFKKLNDLSATLLQPQKHWFWKVINRFKNLFILATILTLLLSLFSFITPLFIMAIYDQVLTSETGEMLGYLGAGILIFMVGDIGFRLIRSHLFSYISIRMGNIVGNEILRRILYLPPEYTESASTGSQLSRLKDFDSIQNFFGGPPILAAYDLPFASLLIIGLVFMGGSLALVPLASVFLFLLFYWVIRPFMERAVEEASSAGAKRHEFLIDLLSNYRAVKLSGYSDQWSKRFREFSADAVLKSYAISRTTSIINTGTSFLVSVTGLATMTVGIYKVLNNEMSSGALMASILLVWRILAPLKSGFGVLNQIGKIQRSVMQLNRLMGMKMERTPETHSEDKKKIRGRVKFSQVSMRYSADSNPALLNISFEAIPGQIMAITGLDGTGKTTILKLMMGLFRSQTGRVTIGNINVRQLNPITLRQVIAYLPQENEIFDGTIMENLLLAKPDAMDDEIERATEEAGILLEIEKLEKGFDTPLKIGSELLDRSFIKALGLAQLFLRKSPIYLIDEPDNGLSEDKLQVVLKGIEKLSARDVVVVVSRKTEILKKADQILWLENNRIKLYGTPDEVLPRMKNKTADKN